MVETVLKVPFELSENLIKMKFSSAIGSLFSISHKRAQLLVEEEEIDGKEVGSIHHARTNFSPDC